MRADASNNSLMRGRPGLPLLVAIAAAATIVALITLVSAQIYPAATIFILLWAAVAAVAVIGSMDQAARSRAPARILAVWFVTAPVAWVFIRVPIEKAILTYERLVDALVGVFALGRPLRSTRSVAPG